MRSKIKTVCQLLPVFVSLLVLFEIGAYSATITPLNQRYLQFYVLSATGATDNYLPNNSLNVTLGQSVKWKLGVVNDMGFVQLVAVLVKLGNQSSLAPNDTLASPSTAPLVAEFEQFMQNEATWTMNFEWQITNSTSTPDGHLRSIDFDIDNVRYSVENPPSCSISSCSLRLIFELWTWNTTSANFQIGWWNGNDHGIAWLQVWFNLVPNQSAM